MDSFELNKLLGAVLGTCLGVLTLNIIAGAIFAPEKLAKPGYDIAVPETKSHAHYVTNARGGKGAIREVVEIILKAQGRWDDQLARYLK